jgi:type I restriction enzyme M protein
MSISSLIIEQLKDTQEQRCVVGPLVEYLCNIGWKIDQIVFGKNEWRIPKTPSQATKREKGTSYQGFPVDIAVFDSPDHLGDPHHLLFIIECKTPDENAGISQLECYFVGEPYAQLGIWTNNADPSTSAVFIYRKGNGTMLLKRRFVNDLPRPGDAIIADARTITFNDLILPNENIFRKIIEDLLDRIVIHDSIVTRREEQLDQLCNIILLKLESDKQAKAAPNNPVMFRPMESKARSAQKIKERYEQFVNLYPETFTTDQDKHLRFADETIALCVDELSGIRLLDLGVTTISLAFQVLRSEALKQKEGQYFTPRAVIEAGTRLMNINLDDIVIDPACGTGGFLVQTLLEVARKYPLMSDGDLSKWAQIHILGIEKDAIGLKLTKAIMQIVGDGSAHCARGDSVRVHKWSSDYKHLASGAYADGRFTKVITNPPFGQNLKVSATDARLSHLDIAKADQNQYQDLEIGLIFLQRAHQLLRKGGLVGIVLPETYFFSTNYSFIIDWIRPRLRPVVVANIPMEAFQGFCRAKTNFYVFEKIGNG